jgi:hypothetical protein
VTPPPSRPLKAILVTGLLTAAALTAGPAVAGVRSEFEPPPDEGWKRLGFFTYKPNFALKNIGQDSNVFYDSDSGDARSDFTATASPAIDGMVTFGRRAFLTMHTQADYVWYETYSTATHLNLDFSLRGNLNFRNLRLFLSDGYQHVEERPSNELDHRSERVSRPKRFGVGYEVSTATAVDVIVARASVEYDDEDFIQYVSCPSKTPGVPPDPHCQQYRIGDLLSRTESSTTLRFTHRIFGRTRLVFDAAQLHHDFQSDVPPPDAHGNTPPVGSFHDARESRALAGFEVDRGGFLSGDLRFGITDFKPRVATELATQTMVGAATLNWRLGGRVALATAYDRDLYFSIYGSNLYFIQSHGEVECVFYLNRVLALDAGYGRYWLNYPRLGTEEPRSDEIRTPKGGLRFRIANRTVARLSVANWARSSNVPNNNTHQLLVTTGVETTF